jgi:hypothetical protein
MATSKTYALIPKLLGHGGTKTQIQIALIKEIAAPVFLANHQR